MRTALLPILVVSAIAAAGAGFSCGGSKNSGGGFGGGGASSTRSASSTGEGGGGAPAFSTGAGNSGPGSDFPKSPIVDASAPPNTPDLFKNAPSSGSGGPCLVEPEPNSLFPNNWLRPRFRWVPTAGETLFELTLHTSGETHDLVVYTANPMWTMPKDMWTGLAQHPDAPITMTIKGGVFDGMNLTMVSTGTSAPMTVAPAGAGGAVVYWTTSNGSSLKGFQVGDESVAQTLIPSQVQMQTDGGAVTCIGCHTSTPDGKYVGFTAQGPWGNALASVETATVGQQPPFMAGSAALAFFNSTAPLGIESYSKAHWSNGDHKMLAPEGDSTGGTPPGSKLVIIDLETTDPAKVATVLNRGGEASEVGTPIWSHDGKTIVYTGGDGSGLEVTGRLGAGDTYVDLFTVPYSNGTGGTAKKIPGASASDVDEFYPSFSPDDELLAFNSVPRGTNMYSQPLDELYVIPASGGTATRLTANDPPMCSGMTSPGITNSWPKWSPSSTTSGGKTYYFLVFSSMRYDGSTPQLYMTGVVVDGSKVQTYGAVYLWNQPDSEHNHTPAWDYFKIPPSPPH